MKNGMEVLKFGGSSLVSADAMKRVRDVLVARRGTQRIVVCSAMGLSLIHISEPTRPY